LWSNSAYFEVFLKHFSSAAFILDLWFSISVHVSLPYSRERIAGEVVYS
jgi:hypothetical protein